AAGGEPAPLGLFGVLFGQADAIGAVEGAEAFGRRGGFAGGRRHGFEVGKSEGDAGSAAEDAAVEAGWHGLVESLARRACLRKSGSGVALFGEEELGGDDLFAQGAESEVVRQEVGGEAVDFFFVGELEGAAK